MADKPYISIQIESINTTQDELQELPNTVSIHSIFLREYTFWAVPMLDFTIIDPANVLTNSANHNLSKGAKVRTSISYLKEKSFLDSFLPDKKTVTYIDTSKDLTFTIASIRPRQVNSSVTVYQVSCFLDSNLLFSKDTWSYTGKMSNSIMDMINPSYPRMIIDQDVIPNFITNIDPNNDKAVRFTKPNNMTYARFLRKTLLPSLVGSDGKSHFMYYHSGHSVILYDMNLVMDEYLALADVDTSSYFVLDETKIIRSSVAVGSFSDEQKNATNGGTAYQYDIDVGEWTSTDVSRSSTSQYTVKNDNISDNRAMSAGVATGNHSNGYLSSQLSATRSQGLYNHIITVEVNFITPVNGLDILIYKTKSGEMIPYVVIGKSTIFRNNMIEQHLRLATNSKPTINSANSIGTSSATKSPAAAPVTSGKSYSSAVYPMTKNSKNYFVHIEVTYSDQAKKVPTGGYVVIFDTTGTAVVCRKIPDTANTQSDVTNFVNSIDFGI